MLDENGLSPQAEDEEFGVSTQISHDMESVPGVKTQQMLNLHPNRSLNP